MPDHAHEKGHEEDPGPEGSSGLSRFSVRVQNLDCENEAASIERGLGGAEGVEAVRVSPRSGRVEVEYRESLTSPEAVSRRLEKLGFPIHEGRGPARPPAPLRNPKVLTSLASGVLLLTGSLLFLVLFFLFFPLVFNRRHFAGPRLGFRNHGIRIKGFPVQDDAFVDSSPRAASRTSGSWSGRPVSSSRSTSSSSRCRWWPTPTSSPTVPPTTRSCC